MKILKKKAGQERRQAIDFKEAGGCSSAIIQGAALQKMVCAWRVLGVTGFLEKANSYFHPSQTGPVIIPPH